MAFGHLALASRAHARRSETGMACRTLLLKLHRRGSVTLPPRQGPSVNHRRGQAFEPVLHDTSTIATSLRGLQPIELIHADSGSERALWQPLIQLYLGFFTRVGKRRQYKHIYSV